MDLRARSGKAEGLTPSSWMGVDFRRRSLSFTHTQSGRHRSISVSCGEAGRARSLTYVGAPDCQGHRRPRGAARRTPLSVPTPLQRLRKPRQVPADDLQRPWRPSGRPGSVLALLTYSRPSPDPRGALTTCTRAPTPCACTHRRERAVAGFAEPPGITWPALAVLAGAGLPVRLAPLRLRIRSSAALPALGPLSRR